MAAHGGHPHSMDIFGCGLHAAERQLGYFHPRRRIVNRYSYGKHKYLDVAYGDHHYVYFDNGKIYAKYW